MAQRKGRARRVVYLLGPDGNDERTGVDCPRCGHAARAELHGRRLALRCYVGCPEPEVAAGLDIGQVTRELLMIGGRR